MVVVRPPEMEWPESSSPEEVAIDSLLSVEQYRGADKASSTGSDGKAIRDIAEVAAATEVLLPKGSARTTSTVRDARTYMYRERHTHRGTQRHAQRRTHTQRHTRTHTEAHAHTHT